MTQMKLIKNEDGQYEPKISSDRAMFMHCTNGSISIFGHYLEDVKPVFEAHGIEIVIVSDVP